VNNRELKKSFERIEISIAVQQRVLLANTERRDQTVNRLPDSMAAAPQRPIVSRCLRCQVHTAFEHFQLEELALDILRSELTTNALEDFAEDHIRESKTLLIELRMEPLGLGIRSALEVIDPNRGVDDYHASYCADRPRREASRSPSQATLPRKRRMLF
jgi:hypothetical protein